MLRRDYVIKNETRGLNINILYSFTSHFVTYLCAFILTPYTARVFGSALIGQYAYVQSVVSVFSLVAALGSSLYGQRVIAEQRINPTKKKKTFWELVALRLSMVLLVGAVYVWIAVRQENSALWLIMGLEIAGVAADITWLYQGEENFRRLAVCTALGKIVVLLGTVTFIKTNKQFLGYALLVQGGGLLYALIEWTGIRRRLGCIQRCHFDRKKLETHLKICTAVFGAQAAMATYTILDKTMIGILTGSDMQVGFYEQAQKVSRFFVMLATIAGSAVASRVSVLWAERNEKGIANLIEIAFHIVFGISVPVAFFLSMIAEWFVPAFYGTGYEEVIILLKLLAIMPLIIGCSNVIGIQYLMPVGREKAMTMSVTVGAVVNCLLNLVLIKTFEAKGAVIGSLAAETVITSIQFFSVKNTFELKKLLKILLCYISISIPIAAVAKTAMSRVEPGLCGILSVTVICAALYGVLWFAVVKKNLSDRMFRS